MKKNKLYIKTIFVALVLLLFLTSLVVDKGKLNLQNEHQNDLNFPKPSFTWETIFISGEEPHDPNEGSLSWSQAVQYPWCSGAGTQANPYVISGLDNTWLTIVHSNKHFIIRDSTFDDVPKGIELKDVSNGKILSNTFGYSLYGVQCFGVSNLEISDNYFDTTGDRGIFFESAATGHDEHGTDIVISNNIIKNSGTGMELSYVRKNLHVYGNTIENCEWRGIDIWGTDYFTDQNLLIEDNIIRNTVRLDGIRLSDIDNAVLRRNVIENNPGGIFIERNCRNIEFSDNRIANNEIGIKSIRIRDSLFNSNIFTENSIAGLVFVTYSSNNEIHKNVFEKNYVGFDIMNDLQAGPECTDNVIWENYFLENIYKHVNEEWGGDDAVNYWNSEAIGNYWDDYQGSDLNNDGIGDSPYVIGIVGSEPFSYDYLPIFSAPVDFSVSRQNIDFIEGNVIVSVTNLHLSYKRDITVQIIEERPDGISVILGEEILRGLKRDEIKIVSVEWIPKLYHNITVIIDPYNLAIDIDRSNNIAKKGGGGNTPQITEVRSKLGVWEDQDTLGTFFTDIKMINTFSIEIYDIDQDIVEVMITLNNHPITAESSDGIIWEFEYDMAKLFFGDNELEIKVRDAKNLQSDIRTIIIKAIAIPIWIFNIELDLDLFEIKIDFVKQIYEISFTVPPEEKNNVTGDVPEEVPFMGGASGDYEFELKFTFKYYLKTKKAEMSAKGSVETELFGASVKGSLELKATMDADLNLLSTEITFDLDVTIPLFSKSIVIPGISLTISCGITAGVHLTVKTIFKVIDDTLQWTTFQIVTTLSINGWLKLKIDLGWVGAGFFANLGGGITLNITIEDDKFVMHLDGYIKMSWRVEWKLLFISGSIGGSLNWKFRVFSPGEVNETSEVEPWAYSENRTNLMDSRPRVAADKNNNAMMVWTQNRQQGDTIYTDICYSTWNGDDWDEAQYITFDEQPDYDPSLTFDSNGNVMAVWSRVTGALDMLTPENPFDILQSQEIAYSIWDGSTSTWSMPQLITDDSFANGRAVVSSGNDGKVLAVWVGDSDYNFTTTKDMEIYYSQWDGNSWTPKEQLTNNNAMDYSTTLDHDSEGNAMICWIRDIDGNRSTVNDRELKYNTWDGNNWDVADTVLISDENKNTPSLTFDLNDNALLTWVTENENSSILYFNKFDKSLQQWTTLEIVHEDDFFIYNPAINIDPNNTAVIVWRGFEDDEEEKLYYLENNATNTYFDGEICYAIKNMSRIDSEWSEIKYLTSDNKTDWMASAVIIRGHSNDLLLVWEKDGVVETLVHEIKPDLYINSSNINFSETYPTEGSMIDIISTISNIGDVEAENIEVSFYEGDPSNGGDLIGTRIVSFLDSGESMNVSLPWEVKSGANEIHVLIDPSYLISELNESNNQAFNMLIVSPDLLVHEITFSDLEPTEGDLISINTLISNPGGTIAEDIKVLFLANNVPIGPPTTISSLGMGENALITIDWYVLAGTNNITVIVDPDKEIPEWNEENNELSNFMQILPDLKMNSLEISAEVILLGDLITINGAIQNIGDAKAENVLIELYDGNPHTSGTLLKSVTIPLIDIGLVEQFTFDGWIPSQGAHQIFMIIDRENRVEELDENNNLIYKEIVVFALADLLILDPEIISAKDQISLNIPIKNNDQGSSSGILVEMYDGDPLNNGELISSQVISYINPGEVEMVGFKISDPPLHDELYIIVDPAFTIIESDESNNQLILSYSQIQFVNAGPDKDVLEGENVGFSATVDIGDVNDLTFTWNFGDGYTDQGVEVIHQYGDNGQFLVTITVEGPNFYGTDDCTITVSNVAPTADAGDDITGIEGGEVFFSGSYSDPGFEDTHVFEWDFGDGTQTSNTLTPSHVFSDNEIYIISLTITDDDGDVGVDTLIVDVFNADPIVYAGEDKTANEDDQVIFSGTVLDPGILDTHTVLWDFGDGQSISDTLTPTHSYAESGVYTVSLTVIDKDGGEGVDYLTLMVYNVNPIANAGDDQTIDEDAELFFDGSNSLDTLSDLPTLEYFWDFGDGFTASGIEVSHIYTYPGEYTVTLMVNDDDGAVDIDDAIVTVLDITDPISTLSVQPPYYKEEDTYYVSTATNFTLSAEDDEMHSGSGVYFILYQIDNGDWNRHEGSELNFTVTQIGPHTVYYYSIDVAGNEEEVKSIEIVVNASKLTYLGGFEGIYSDPVILKANLTDIATGDPILGKTINFTLGTQTVTAITDSDGIACVTLILNQSKGIYPFSASFGGDIEYLASKSVENEFTIGKEHAYAEYTGNMVVPLNVETITIRATVFDDDDGYWGDLTKINVTITILDSTTISQLGTHTYSLEVEVTNVEGVGVALITIFNDLNEGDYLVLISFESDENDYYEGDISIPVVLIIYKPVGDFVTGGGWIEDSNGNKGNFGFNVKYKKNGLPKGQAIYVYREGDFIYIVKANAWIGMAIISDMNYTIFEAKCNVKQLNATTGEIIWMEGNYKLVIEAWDHSQDGKEDVFQIRVYDKIGLIYHEAGFDPYGFLCGGNIVIHTYKKK